MSSQPKVSVVIPVYNSAPYLEQCLKSVASQTLKNIEVICVDDGSTDESWNIVQSFVDNDSRFIGLQQHNLGAGAARNLALTRATGEYLSFLDSDDFFEPNMLERFTETMDADGSDVAVCYASEHDHQAGRSKWMPWSLRIENCPAHSPFRPDEMPERLLNSFKTWPWNKMFRHSFVQQNNLSFQEIPRTNDMAFVVCALTLARSISVINRCFVHYRVNTGTSLQQTNYKAPSAFWEAYLETKRRLQSYGVYETYEQSFLNAVVTGSVYNLQTLESSKDAYDQVLALLRSSADDEFGFSQHPYNYYFERKSYDQLLQLLASEDEPSPLESEPVRSASDKALSIILTVQNGEEEHLSQALTSVLGQSAKEIEIICVDDGSSEAAADILKRFSKRDKRVTVVERDGLSVGELRNIGIGMAQGEFIHFLEATDYVLDYAYEAILDKARKHQVDCIKFCNVAFDEEMQCTVEDDDCKLSKLRPGDYNRLFALNHNDKAYSLNTAAWSGIYRRSFLLEHNIEFKGLAHYDDRAFYYHVCTTAKRIMASLDRLVVHRIGMPRPEASQAIDELNCLIASTKTVETQLRADNIDELVLKKIMLTEFEFLIAWCQENAKDPNHCLTILAEVDAFLESFSYSFMRAPLKKFWLLERRAKVDFAARNGNMEYVPAEQERKESRVFFKKCRKPRVSVVVPIYNQEDYLNQALHSLTTQSLKNIEFICVNDGSTDTSMTILREYAAIDERIRIIDKPNTGYGNTMNVGFDVARGEYLGILEPDDYVLPKMFGDLYEIARDNDLDFVKSNFYRFTTEDSGRIRRQANRLTKDKSYYSRVVNTSEDISTFNFIMNTWSGIYKISFLKEWGIRHNETPGASFQDNGFYFQTFCRATRAWFAEGFYYMNRRDNENSSVFNPGKVYAMTNEYQYIHDWIQSDPQLDRFEPIYYVRKLGNSLFTYRRIAPEKKLDYLYHIRDEFAPIMAAGTLKKELFSPMQWEFLHEILKDPERFHSEVRLSVVVVAHNDEGTIRRCIESLLANDEMQFEILCIDNGSQDNTWSVIREYEELDARVRAIEQDETTVEAAFNRGIAEARGEYLMLADGGLFYNEDSLYRIYHSAREGTSDIVLFGFDYYDDSTEAFLEAKRGTIWESLPLDPVFSTDDATRPAFTAITSESFNKAFRTNFIRDNALYFDEIESGGNLIFSFAAYAQASRISAVRTVLVHDTHNPDDDGSFAEQLTLGDALHENAIALRKRLEYSSLFERFERDYINYFVHEHLFVFRKLRGDALKRYHANLKGNWLEYLGAPDKDDLFFESLLDYTTLKNIMASTDDEFLVYVHDELVRQRDDLTKKGRKSAQDLRKAKKSVEYRGKLLERERERRREIEDALWYRTVRLAGRVPVAAAKASIDVAGAVKTKILNRRK